MTNIEEETLSRTISHNVSETSDNKTFKVG